MIDLSGACSSTDQALTRGLTSNIHAVVDANGLPVHLALTPSEAHDNRLCTTLPSALLPQTMLLADRGYNADWIREFARQKGAWANIPANWAGSSRKPKNCYRSEVLVEMVPKLRLMQPRPAGLSHFPSQAIFQFLFS
jgi:transposase